MAATPAAAPHSARWLILAVLATGQMLVMLDVSIVNTAIPSIARSFQASSSTLQWIVDSYALLFAGLLLLSGALGDRFGRRRLLGLGLLVFIAASIGASLSNTATTLILMRGVQGVGAAMAMPQTLSILTAVFPREERSRALGLWTAALGLGTAGGPLVGGALVDAIDWSAVFWVPAPVAALAFLGLRIVPESRSEGQHKLDLPGAALGTIAMIALVYGVIEGHDAGWASAEIIAAFGVAGGTAVAFLFVESRAESPMVPLKFFRSRDFNGSLVVLFLTFFALLSVMFFLSQYFQLVQGQSAFQSGAAAAADGDRPNGHRAHRRAADPRPGAQDLDRSGDGECRWCARVSHAARCLHSLLADRHRARPFRYGGRAGDADRDRHDDGRRARERGGARLRGQ